MSAMPWPADTPALRPTHASPEAVVERDLLATLEPLGGRGRAWIAGLAAFVGAAFVAWVYQLVHGLRVTDMRNVVSWGTYMTNFVFFIGISHAGTLISAILRVTDAGWRRPITRMAEAITCIALLVGASMVVIDMGRPDRVMNLILHGRFQSPILWDLVSVTTYLTGSFFYLYVAMIPDMPIMARNARERGRSPRLVRFYEILSLGFRETPEHRRLLARALGAMAVIIIPVAVSVHTVVSWVFGMTLRPGWHSTIFGPYFVIGAIFSGTAALITAMLIFRKAYHLEKYLRPEHFHKLSKILLALTLLYGYFTLSEYLTTWYGGEHIDVRLLALLAGNGTVGAVFWSWATFGLFVPIALLLFPSRRSLGSIMTASILINIGMWVKRYLIIVPTLETPFIPAEAGGMQPHYFPSPIEITITVGAFAGFVLLYILFSRIFPILSIWETVEDLEETEHAKLRAPVRMPGRAIPAALPVLIAALGLSMSAAWTPARAQAGAASAGPAVAAAHIDLKRTNEDKQEMLVATVTANGKPVAGATVAFAVTRSFGSMQLGEDQTLDDGTAAVKYPHGLPGDARGEQTFSVEVKSPPAVAGAPVLVTLGGAEPLNAGPVQVPRALWSSRVPLALLGTILALLLFVWSTYAFVASQLVAMYRLKEEA